MKPIAVTTTVGCLPDAKRLADALVRRGLAACAQISAIESVYRWQGEVRAEAEWRVVFKTTNARCWHCTPTICRTSTPSPSTACTRRMPSG